MKERPASPRPHPSAVAGPEDEPDLDGAAPGECYVVFSVDMHGYALRVDDVHHVLPMPRVTRAPTDAPHALGVFHYAGRVLALWDLHTLFGADGPPPERPSVLVVEHEGHPVGLLVDQVDEVVAVEKTEVIAAEEERLPLHVSEMVQGWIRVPEPDESEDGPSEDADARPPDDAPDLQSMLASTGRPDRGAAILALLAPVHLIDLGRLFRFGAGERPTEVSHGRP